jgi:hypothetical protein
VQTKVLDPDIIIIMTQLNRKSNADPKLAGNGRLIPRAADLKGIIAC